jgi:predicted HicB family RNase H-like nuclease
MRTERPKDRKIHIVVSDDVHQRLRIKCAIEDLSIQEFVARLLAEAVKDVRVPAAKEK